MLHHPKRHPRSADQSQQKNLCPPGYRFAPGPSVFPQRGVFLLGLFHLDSVPLYAVSGFLLLQAPNSSQSPPFHAMVDPLRFTFILQLGPLIRKRPAEFPDHRTQFLYLMRYCLAVCRFFLFASSAFLGSPAMIALSTSLCSLTASAMRPGRMAIRR